MEKSREPIELEAANDFVHTSEPRERPSIVVTAENPLNNYETRDSVWQQVYDDETGELYEYNMETGESRWVYDEE